MTKPLPPHPTATGQPPRLLRNELCAGLPTPLNKLSHHWIRFKLTGTKSNRDAIGAWIELELDGRTLRRQVMPSRSYLSQVELPVTFGLGPDEKVRSATIHWPSGTQQEIEVAEVDRLIEVVEP